jgi:hypothetical protein
LAKRVRPAQRAYGGCFPRAQHWCSITLALRARAGDARLVLDGGDLGPPPPGPDGTPLASGPEDEEMLLAVCAAMQAVPAGLRDFGVLGGALAVLEWAVSIDPCPAGGDPYAEWSRLRHCVWPHLHILANSDAPITAEVARQILRAFGQVLAAVGCGLHPDVKIEAIVGQAGGRRSVRGWVNYIMKCLPVEAWYRGAARRRGCSREDLNLLLDDLLDNLVCLNGWSCAVRRLGNMNPQARSYIGRRPVKRRKRRRPVRPKAIAIDEP